MKIKVKLKYQLKISWIRSDIYLQMDFQKTK
jgi:hypothetical protein